MTGLIGVAFVGWFSRAFDVPPPSHRPAASAAEKAQSAWAVVVSKSIRASAHDPESIDWIYAGVTPDAAVGCVEYRAKNRLGALVRERVVVHGGKFSRDPKAVEIGCGADARVAMRDMVGVFRYYP